jgi:hypothetical protein
MEDHGGIPNDLTQPRPVPDVANHGFNTGSIVRYQVVAGDVVAVHVQFAGECSADESRSTGDYSALSHRTPLCNRADVRGRRTRAERSGAARREQG